MIRRARARLAVLRVLREMGGPVGAARIAERVGGEGVTLQPRTVRFYLRQLDAEGLTRYVGRRAGRALTERGREELDRSDVLGKVGFVAPKVDVLGYRMSFSPGDGTGQGTIVANVATISQKDMARAIMRMQPVFEHGLGMGNRVALAEDGTGLAGLAVPPGSLGIGTICSVTVNGVLLHAGIPVHSRFGGLLEMRDGQPVRFVELIEYAGTTVDPLEIFILAGRTSVTRCAETGSGIVGASFREIPSPALDDVRRIRRQMERQGLGGILALGKPNVPLLDIPVADGRTGLVVVGGLNPVAALHEAGIPVSIRPLAGLEPIERFKPFAELTPRARPRSPYRE